jgi:hypothetical protein
MNTITTQLESVSVGSLAQAAVKPRGGPHLSPAETFALLFHKYHPPITRGESVRRRIHVQWHAPSTLEENE